MLQSCIVSSFIPFLSYPTQGHIAVYACISSMDKQKISVVRVISLETFYQKKKVLNYEFKGCGL